MIEIVVIGHNEGVYVTDMINSLPKKLPIHYVADRCTDDTLSTLSKFDNVDVIDTTHFRLQGRQTSFCRNLGASLCNVDSDVLFLDGDRFIACGDLNDVNNVSNDITLLQLEDDGRTNDIIQKSYGSFYNGFYSCGILIKNNALKRIREFQNGEIFLTELQSEWGCEDTYLGDVCYHLGLTVELNEYIRLRGKFERFDVPRMSMLRRLRKRSMLNVIKN